MEFTREELGVIFQALCLADKYYSDPHSRVAKMHPPTPAIRAQRKKHLQPVINRIMEHAKELT